MKSPQGKQQAPTFGPFHAVRFYENPRAMARLVAGFLGDGIVAGQPVIIVSTPEHSDAILRELRGRRFNIDALQVAGELLLMDARDTLSTFMVDGVPDGALFAAHMGRVMDHLARGRKHCVVHIYGEMVDLLCKDQLTDAALRLEMLWNELTRTHDFSLLCGYGNAHDYKDSCMEDIYLLHSHVFSADGTPHPI